MNETWCCTECSWENEPDKLSCSRCGYPKDGTPLSDPMRHMKTTLVNRHKDKYDVYIGRGTPFGNPYIIGKDGDREEVIQKYLIHFKYQIRNNPKFKEQVDALKGKILGCSCSPKKCHGDVILQYLDGLDRPSREEYITSLEGDDKNV
jgi:hypothetical protein